MNFISNAIIKIGKFGPLLVFLIGLHSIALGIVIYFYTDFFYQKFFSASVENIFFVRQSGVFLFLAGFFYLAILLAGLGAGPTDRSKNTLDGRTISCGVGDAWSAIRDTSSSAARSPMS